MLRATLSVAGLLAILVAAVITGGLPATAQVGETCGITVYSEGQLVWIPLPCGALTPPATGVPASSTPVATATATVASTPTGTMTPTLTPSATWTPWPTPTPEVWTATATVASTVTPGVTSTPPYCKAVPDGAYRVNIRTAPGISAAVVGQVQVGEWVEITGETQDAGGAWWLQIDRGWVAGWVMRVDCPGSFLEFGP